MRYLELAEELQKEIGALIKMCSIEDNSAAHVKLGHIVNLAIRCNPRQPQGTVRKNIVTTAMRNYCRVTMTREKDEESGREFNKIHIVAKSPTRNP